MKIKEVIIVITIISVIIVILSTVIMSHTKKAYSTQDCEFIFNLCQLRVYEDETRKEYLIMQCGDKIIDIMQLPETTD